GMSLEPSLRQRGSRGSGGRATDTDGSNSARSAQRTPAGRPFGRYEPAGVPRRGEFQARWVTPMAHTLSSRRLRWTDVTASETNQPQILPPFVNANQSNYRGERYCPASLSLQSMPQLIQEASRPNAPQLNN